MSTTTKSKISSAYIHQRSRCCFAPLNLHPQHKRHHPILSARPPMHPPSSPNPLLLQRGLQVAREPSNSVEFSRAQSARTAFVSFVQVSASHPMYSNVPTMCILRLLGLPILTGKDTTQQFANNADANRRTVRFSKQQPQQTPAKQM